MAKSLSSGHRKSAVTAKYPSRPRPRKEAPKSKEQQRYYQAGSDTQSLPGGALPPPYKNTYLEKFGAPPPRKKTVSKAAVAPTANSAAQPSLSVPLLPGRRHNGHRHGPGGPPAHTPAQAWTDETTGELYLYQEGQWSRLPASSNNGALTFAIDGPNNLLKGRPLPLSLPIPTQAVVTPSTAGTPAVPIPNTPLLPSTDNAPADSTAPPSQTTDGNGPSTAEVVSAPSALATPSLSILPSGYLGGDWQPLVIQYLALDRPGQLYLVGTVTVQALPQLPGEAPLTVEARLRLRPDQAIYGRDHHSLQSLIPGGYGSLTVHHSEGVPAGRYHLELAVTRQASWQIVSSKLSGFFLPGIVTI